MRHAEFVYLELGRKLERATCNAQARDVSWDIRYKIAQEEPEDRAEAKRLVDRGRQEIRRGS